MKVETVQKRILVAEDEKAMAHALEVKLTKAGFVVDLASDGKTALEKIQSGKYELILLDIMMPKLNGFEILESLEKTGNTVPVIVTSNLGQDEDAKRAKSLGAAEYFIKSNTPIGIIVDKVIAMLG
jgi:DNA-binding response OmpR family regulator